MLAHMAGNNMGTFVYQLACSMTYGCFDMLCCFDMQCGGQIGGSIAYKFGLHLGRAGRAQGGTDASG